MLRRPKVPFHLIITTFGALLSPTHPPFTFFYDMGTWAGQAGVYGSYVTPACSFYYLHCCCDYIYAMAKELRGDLSPLEKTKRECTN